MTRSTTTGRSPAPRPQHRAASWIAPTIASWRGTTSPRRPAAGPRYLLGGKLAGRYDLGMLCVMAGSPNGYDTLDYNWALACAEAAAQGRVMDRANYRVMARYHLAETPRRRSPLSARRQARRALRPRHAVRDGGQPQR